MGRGGLGGPGPTSAPQQPQAQLSRGPRDPGHACAAPPSWETPPSWEHPATKDRSGTEKIITGLCPGKEHPPLCSCVATLGMGTGDPPPQTPQLHGTGVHPSLVPAGEGSSGGIFTAKSHKKPTVGTMLTAMPCSPAHHGGITPQPLCWGQIKALGGGGGRDERAADLALLVLNYSLEKAEIKRQEAPAGAPWAWACLVRRCFPFFYSLFPLCLFDGAQQTIPPPPPPRTPTQRGGPRMGGCPPPLCWVGC